MELLSEDDLNLKGMTLRNSIAPVATEELSLRSLRPALFIDKSNVCTCSFLVNLAVSKRETEGEPLKRLLPAQSGLA